MTARSYCAPSPTQTGGLRIRSPCKGYPCNFRVYLPLASNLYGKNLCLDWTNVHHFQGESNKPPNFAHILRNVPGTKRRSDRATIGAGIRRYIEDNFRSVACHYLPIIIQGVPPPLAKMTSGFRALYKNFSAGLVVIMLRGAGVLRLSQRARMNLWGNIAKVGDKAGRERGSIEKNTRVSAGIPGAYAAEAPSPYSSPLAGVKISL